MRKSKQQKPIGDNMDNTTKRPIGKPIGFYTAWNDFTLVCRKQLHSNQQDTPGEHWHNDFYELVTVSSGHGVHKAENRTWNISPGSVFLIHPHQRHCYVEYDNLLIYNLLFTRKFLRLFLPDLTRLPGYQLLFNVSPKEIIHSPNDGIRIQEEHIPEIIRLLDEMDMLNTSLQPGDKSLMISHFIKAVLLLTRHSHLASRSNRGHQMEQLTSLLSKLENHYSEQWTLHSMAAATNMSVSNFRLSFCKLMGLSPIEYLLRLRLAKSLIKLETSTVPIEEIAFSCGFNTPNYFTRQFKAHYNILPARYRREYLAGLRPPIIDQNNIAPPSAK